MIWGGPKDDTARLEAYEDGGKRRVKSIRGVHGRIPFPDHVRRQRFGVSAILLYEKAARKNLLHAHIS